MSYQSEEDDGMEILEDVVTASGRLGTKGDQGSVGGTRRTEAQGPHGHPGPKVSNGRCNIYMLQVNLPSQAAVSHIIAY